MHLGSVNSQKKKIPIRYEKYEILCADRQCHIKLKNRVPSYSEQLHHDTKTMTMIVTLTGSASKKNFLGDVTE